MLKDKTLQSLLKELEIEERSDAYALYIYALRLMVREHKCTCSMIKEIYHPLSLHFGHTMNYIERTMREAVVRAYNNKRETINILAGAGLSVCPTVSEFLRILWKCCKY